MLCYFDIETIPSNDPQVIADLEASIAAPANYKKPESIDEWMKENKTSVLAEKLAKTALDGLYGRIACIAWAFEDGQVMSTRKDQAEDECLEYFFAEVSAQGRASHQGMTFCGHNISGFDLPFIKHRSMILGVQPPSSIRMAINAKPWGAEIADTMLMWSSDREKRVSMDKLCKAFGIPGKNGFDGSMVADTWATDPQKVIDYCMDDVARTRLIHKKLLWI